MTIQALIVRFRALPRWGQWGLGLAALLAIGLAALVLPGEGAGGGTSGEAELAIRLTFSFGIVIGLIYLSLWAVRRFTHLASRRGRLLHTIESLRLSPRQAVHLIRVGDRTFLIGATDGGLQTLAEVELEPGGETLPAAAPPSPEALFNRVLRGEVTL